MNADGLTFSPDGKTAYISGVGSNGYDIFVATRNSLNEPFGTPTEVPGLNGPGEQRAPTLTITPNGHRLYFTNAPAGWRDIAFADRQVNGQFGPAQTMAAGFNYPGGVHDQDPFWWGTETLLFASERPDGSQRDIYSATVNGSTHSALQKLTDAGINLGSEDFRPVLTPDGRTLYFASKRGGIGGDNEGDVWVTTRSSLGTPFGQPQNVWAMNSSRAEFPVAVSGDGCTVYFASNEELFDTGDNYRLYEARRGTSTPPQVSVSINIIGTGSVTAPVNCSTGNAGTCTLTGAPGTTTGMLASSQARWTGICTGQGGSLSSDAVVAFAEGGVCTVTFPGGSANGMGGACSLNMDCQEGLECKLGVCRCVPGTPGCGACDPAAPFDPPAAAFTGTSLVDGITFSADGRTAYLSGKLPPETSSQIYVTSRDTETAPFGPLQLFSVANTSNSERPPSLSADGARLYFGRYASSGARFQLMVTSYNSTTQQWGAPLSLGVNQSGLHDQDPFFLSSTSQLFFAAEPSDGVRNLRVSPLASGGNPHTAWTDISFVPGLSPAEDEYRPILSPDGLTLYLSSTRSGIGADTGGDIWVARRAPNNPSFGPLTNLGSLNTNRVEFPAGISNDGCTLYFASNRDTSNINDYRLYQATRGTSRLPTVSTTLKVVGTGSVVTPGYQCSTTCAFQGTPDSTVVLATSTQAIWSGSCAANGTNPNSDGTLVFTRDGTCTVTFSNGSPSGPDAGCTSPAGCEEGLECTLNVCRCTPGTPGCACQSPPPEEDPDCPFSVPMLAIGRDGHDPFDFPIDPANGLINFNEKNERTTRAFMYAGFNKFAEYGIKLDNEVAITAAAWGDFDGDGEEQLVLGLTAAGADSERMTVFGPGRIDELGPQKHLFHGWSTSHYPTAIEAGDVDGDGVDEIVVGRHMGPNVGDVAGHEFFILEQENDDYTENGEFVYLHPGDDIGNRSIRDIAIGNSDNDPELEILVARDGQGDSTDGRIVLYQKKPNAPGFFKSDFADDWGVSSRGATAVAVGDLDGDCRPEVAVGRNAGGGHRILIYRFNPANGGYSRVGNFATWGDDRAVTALAFADLDGNGDDELIAGRNGCSDPGCSAGPRLFVYDAPFNSDLEARVLKELGGENTGGEGWGDERSVLSLATADIDDDGVAEIVAGRSEGEGPRVIVFDDMLHDFAEIYRTGGMWGDERSANALAFSKQRLCQSRPARELPADVTAATAGFPARRAEAIRVQLGPVLSNLRRLQGVVTPAVAESVFGKWGYPGEHQNMNIPLRRMLAGAAAIKLDVAELKAERDELLQWNFPDLMNLYIVSNVDMYKDAGTNDDLDFTMMKLVELAYYLEDVEDPRATGTPLLHDISISRLLLYMPYVQLDALDLTASVPAFLRDNVDPLDFVIPYAGQEPHRLFTPTVPIPFPPLVGEPVSYVGFPETENHILMINTWAYLVNQWIAEGRRGLPPVFGEPDYYQNSGSSLERFLFAVVGRFLKNGSWETNARAYQAYTMRALQILARYASNEKMRKAAKNALDTLVAKFAFQSLHGKRMPPMRRNWEYRYKIGVYQHDYVAAQLGVLSGATVFDTSPECSGHLCAYRGESPPGFALESALLHPDTSNSEDPGYAIPSLLIDFMLHPGGAEGELGAWARMQDRFTEQHLFPIYPPDNGMFSWDINQDIFAGAKSIEPQAEFYFLTNDYMNSAGGHAERVSLLSVIPDSVPGVDPFDLAKVKHGTDFVSKPAILIGNRDVGYWTEAAGAAQETLSFSGGPDGAYSDNRGVYKNVVYGSGRVRVPLHWRLGPSATLGDAEFTIVDPDSVGSAFSSPAPYLVIANLPLSWGLWEVVPRGRFPGATPQEVLNHVLAANAGNSLSATAGYHYTTVVSGEVLRLNRAFPGDRPFTSIDGDVARTVDQHLNPVAENMPLMDVRQVGANYRFTDVSYVCASGDGRVVINNPAFGKRLILDSRNHLAPERHLVDITASSPDPCTNGFPNANANVDPGD